MGMGIADDPTIVARVNGVIDICQVIANHSPLPINPDLSPKQPVAPFARDGEGLVDNLCLRHVPLCHVWWMVIPLILDTARNHVEPEGLGIGGQGNSSLCQTGCVAQSLQDVFAIEVRVVGEEVLD